MDAARATRSTEGYRRPLGSGVSQLDAGRPLTKRYVGSTGVANTVARSPLGVTRGSTSDRATSGGFVTTRPNDRNRFFLNTPRFGLGLTRTGNDWNAAVRFGRPKSYHSRYGYGGTDYGYGSSSFLGTGYAYGYPSAYSRRTTRGGWWSYGANYPSSYLSFGYRQYYPSYGQSYCRPASSYYRSYYNPYYPTSGSYYGTTLYGSGYGTGYGTGYDTGDVYYADEINNYGYGPTTGQVIEQTAPTTGNSYYDQLDAEASGTITTEPSTSGAPFTPPSGPYAPTTGTPYNEPSSATTPTGPAAMTTTPAPATPSPAWQKYMDEGLAAYQAGRFDDAQRSYMRAIVADDRHALSSLLFGYANFAVGSYDLSAAAVQRALETDPGLLRAPLDIRSLYSDPAVLESQVASLNAYIAAHPGAGDAQFVLAYVLFAAEQPDRAWFIVSDLAKQNPDDPLLKEFQASIGAVIESAAPKKE